MTTIAIEEPLSGNAVQAVDGSWIVSVAVPQCVLCLHTSGNNPCELCQPAGSGKICLPCRFRPGVPALDPSPPGPIELPEMAP